MLTYLLVSESDSNKKFSFTKSAIADLPSTGVQSIHIENEVPVEIDDKYFQWKSKYTEQNSELVDCGVEPGATSYNEWIKETNDAQAEAETSSRMKLAMQLRDMVSDESNQKYYGDKNEYTYKNTDTSKSVLTLTESMTGKKTIFESLTKVKVKTPGPNRSSRTKVSRAQNLSNSTSKFKLSNRKRKAKKNKSPEKFGRTRTPTGTTSENKNKRMSRVSVNSDQQPHRHKGSSNVMVKPKTSRNTERKDSKAKVTSERVPRSCRGHHSTENVDNKKAHRHSTDTNQSKNSADSNSNNNPDSKMRILSRDQTRRHKTESKVSKRASADKLKEDKRRSQDAKRRTKDSR